MQFTMKYNSPDKQSYDAINYVLLNKDKNENNYEKYEHNKILHCIYYDS